MPVTVVLPRALLPYSHGQPSLALSGPCASVREPPFAWSWDDSPIFTAFRGTDWMPDPCRSCDRREVDFGGCRCQAFQLTGDAGRTDPVCHLSPDHDLVAQAVEDANAGSPPGGLSLIPPPPPAGPPTPTAGAPPRWSAWTPPTRPARAG